MSKMIYSGMTNVSANSIKSQDY